MPSAPSVPGRIGIQLPRSRLSTLAPDRLHRLNALCDEGGAIAAQMALAELAQAAGLPAAPVAGQAQVPPWGFYDPDAGVITNPLPGDNPVLVSFYRSYLTSADTDPVDALIRAFRAEGIAACGVYSASLKAPGFADWLQPHLVANPPLAVVNATAFSARGDDGAAPVEISRRSCRQKASRCIRGLRRYRQPQCARRRCRPSHRPP